MKQLTPIFWLTIISLAGLVLRLNGAADPFLHVWDERFHALVAKNLLLHPLLPTLYETPVLPFDFRDWSACHLWLSKGPLPLWAMAGSFQLFGIAEWSLRLPSLLFSMGGIWLTFSIGRRLFDVRTGLWAAFFQAIHGLTIEVASGKISSDHAETAFLFYAELAFLFVVLFNEKQQKRLLFAAGMAVGAAFLCKWTAAFVVLFLLVASLFLLADRWQKAVRQAGLATAAFLLMAVPWPLFLWKNHPTEAAWIFRELLAPTVSVVQNHGGEWWFYLDQVRMKFGELIYLPLGWLVFRVFRKPVLSERLLFVWSVLPLLLLSIFATKRSTYLLLAGPGLFLLTAHFSLFLNEKQAIGWKNGLKWLILIGLVALPIRYSIERTDFDWPKKQPEWRVDFQKLEAAAGQKRAVVFEEPNPIEAMFYTRIVAAYRFKPTAEQVLELKKEGYFLLKKEGRGYVEW